MLAPISIRRCLPRVLPAKPKNPPTKQDYKLKEGYQMLLNWVLSFLRFSNYKQMSIDFLEEMLFNSLNVKDIVRKFTSKADSNNFK
jgi:hypothetical protein